MLNILRLYFNYNNKNIRHTLNLKHLYVLENWFSNDCSLMEPESPLAYRK